MPSLIKEAAATCQCTVIHDFVTSCLDNSTAPLYGLPKCTTYKLQKVQNAATRTLTSAKKRGHVHHSYTIFTGYQFSQFEIAIQRCKG